MIQTETTASALHQKANQFFEASKYKEAIEAYEQAAALFEKEGNIEMYLFCWTDIGWCYVDLFDFQTALPIIEDTLQKCLDSLGERHRSTHQSYHNLGYYYYQLKDFDKAIEVFLVEWKLIEETYGKNDDRLFLLCNNIGLSYQEKKDYFRAFDYFHKGIALSKMHNLENTIDAIHLYGSLGSNYWFVGDLNQSLYYLEKASKEAIALIGENAGSTLVYYCNLAIIYSDKGDYENSLLYQKKSLKLCLQIFGEQHPSTHTIYNNFGVFYDGIGDYKEAANYHQKTLLLRMQFCEEGDANIAMSLYNLGASMLNSSKEEEGAKKLYQALELFEKNKEINIEYMAGIYAKLGNFYARKEKNLQKAIDYHLRGVAIKETKLGVGCFDALKSYKEIGGIFLQFGHYAKATSFFKKILSSENLDRQHFLFAEAYLGLGKCAFRQLQLDTALQYLQKALQSIIVDYSNDNFLHIPNIQQKNLGAKILLYILQAKAEVLFHNLQDTHRIFAALLHCQVALRLIEKTYQSFNNSESKLALADASFEVMELGVTIAHFLSTLEIPLEKVANKLAKINADSYPPMKLHYAQNTLDCQNIAFLFSEKSKAFLLLSNLQDSQAKYEAAIPQDLLQKEYHLKVELNYLNKRIQQLKAQEGESAEKQVLELQSEYFDHHQTYQRLIQQFEQDYPEYHQLKYQIQTIGVEALQKKVSKNQLLIEYFIGEKYLYIFCIDHNQFEVIQQDKPHNLDKLIKDFNKGLNRVILSKYAQSAYQLYQILLAPILQYRNQSIQQLILITSGILSTLPFEALLCSYSNKSAILQYSNLDYLLLHYDVVYHYSATLWKQGQAKFKKEGLEDSFVGFAPVYQSSGFLEPQKRTKESIVSSKHSSEPQKEQKRTKESIVSSKHSSEPQKEQKGAKESIVSSKHSNEPQKEEKRIKESAGMRSIRIGEKSYQALLYSEAEVRGIQAAFKAKKLPQYTFLHERATKSNFEEAVKGRTYVLIAAHGFYNKKQPELSGIIFSPENMEKSEEAVLYVNDAYHLDLKHTDLVVLSACESGIGKLAKGEGMMAVNRGFLYSGAKNVIFTLFKVYDEQSSQLTQALFRYILEGKTYSEALRLAKLELIRNSDADPKAWAGFVMIGGGG